MRYGRTRSYMRAARWRNVGTPRGEVPALLPPGSWDDGDPRMDPVPALGEHTGAILESLGYSAAQLEVLRAERGGLTHAASRHLSVRTWRPAGAL